MTRRRFLKLRQAFVVALQQYYKGTPTELDAPGKTFKAMRNHSPVLEGNASNYADCWKVLEPLCGLYGMKVRK